MNNKTEKQFDCIKMKRQIQERIYAETKGLTPEELLAYIKQKAAQGPFATLVANRQPR